MSQRQVSLQQLKLLLDYMEQHRDLATGRVRSKEGRAKSKRLWSEFAPKLNAEGRPASYRTAKEWSIFYTDYKCRVRAKVRKNLLRQQNTSIRPEESATPLTPMEQRLCTIVGPDTDKFPVELRPSAVNAIDSEPEFSVNEYTVENEIESVSHQNLRKEKQRKRKKSPIRFESAKNILLEIEKSRLELQQAQLEVEKKRNEIELQKVHALNYLANAVWAMANKSSKNQVPESNNTSISSED